MSLLSVCYCETIRRRIRGKKSLFTDWKWVRTWSCDFCQNTKLKLPVCRAPYGLQTLLTFAVLITKSCPARTRWNIKADKKSNDLMGKPLVEWFVVRLSSMHRALAHWNTQKQMRGTVSYYCNWTSHSIAQQHESIWHYRFMVTRFT